MTKQKTTKKTLLTSVLSLVLCMAMLIGTTFAWFTDSVTSGNNKIVSGNLDVELWHCPNNQAQWGFGYDEATGTEIKGDTALFLNADGKPILWEPGAGAGETFRVKNAGSLALKFKLNLKTINATKTPEGKDLTDVLNLQVIELVNNENGVPGHYAGDVNYEGLFGDGYIIEGELLPGETADFNVAIDWFPSANDNDYNVAGGLEITFAIDLLATQLTYEKDSWDDQYDKDADYDGEISNATSLAAALAKGGTYKVMNDIVLKESLTVPAGKTVNLDLGGKSITSTATAIINEGIMTIANGKVENTTVNGAATLNNKGTMVLDGAEIIGAPLGETGYPAYTVLTSGKLTVEEGTNITANRGAISTSGSAELVINGGNITVTDALGSRVLTSHAIYAYGRNTTVTIYGGNFAMDYEAAKNTGASIICPAGAAISVYSGNFTFAGVKGGQSGIIQNYMGYGVPINVYGGTYNDTTFKKHVAEGYVATENADGIYTVMEGVMVNDSDELETAIKGNEEKIVLAEGDYTMPDGSDISLRNKSLTIIGTKDTVIDVSQVDERDQFVTGATILFEGVTLNFGTTNYMGFANATSLTYKNCAINGLQFLYGPSVTFEDCVLNSNGAEHSVWTWGVQNVSFTRCNFTYGDRAVNCYGEKVTTNASFTDCTFTKVAGKDTTGAIETNSSALTALNLTITNCSVNEGDLWWVAQWDSLGGERTTVNGVSAKNE